MSQGSLQLFHSLALGFAISGLLVSVYRALADKPASFRLPAGRRCRRGAGGALPRFRRSGHHRPQHDPRPPDREPPFEFVFLATFIALVWSLMSGRVLTMVLRGLGF